MNTYLIYCYDQDDLVRSGLHVECLDENEALASACREMRPDDLRVEVWQRCRRLYLVVGDHVGPAPSTQSSSQADACRFSRTWRRSNGYLRPPKANRPAA